MLEAIDGMILNASPLAYWVACALTLVAGGLVYAMSGSVALTLPFIPAVWVGALAGNYAFREAGIILMPDRDSNLVLTSGAGMIVAAVVVFLVLRATHVYDASRKYARRNQSS